MANVALDELESDLLGEAFNIGIGTAANALSQMVGQEVQIQVPTVTILSLSEMVETLGGEEANLCGISQPMSGAFDSKALLVFPEDKSLEVVKLMLGTSLPYETLLELYQDSLLEIGNILINACIAAVSDFLGMRFMVGLPQFHSSPPTPLLALVETSGHSEFFMSVHIDLTLVESNIHGMMGFILGAEALAVLRQQLAEFLQQL